MRAGPRLKTRPFFDAGRPQVVPEVTPRGRFAELVLPAIIHKRPRGRSLASIKPCFLHPARRSQVSGVWVTCSPMVAGGPCDGGTRQPSNDDADEQPSISAAWGMCFLAFIRT